MKKKPLTPQQASFVLHGMLKTITRIQKDCGLNNPIDSLSITKVRASLHALIFRLKGDNNADS